MELPLALLGIVASLLVSTLKEQIEGKRRRIVAAIAISFIAALGYTILVEFGLWQAFQQVLVTAGAFYAFIWKHVEDRAEDN